MPRNGGRSDNVPEDDPAFNQTIAHGAGGEVSIEYKGATSDLELTVLTERIIRCRPLRQGRIAPSLRKGRRARGPQRLWRWQQGRGLGQGRRGPGRYREQELKRAEEFLKVSLFGFSLSWLGELRLFLRLCWREAGYGCELGSSEKCRG